MNKTNIETDVAIFEYVLRISGSKRNADSIRINEIEIENARLKQDLKRLRETITNNNNHDEASMDQMKELMDQFETSQVMIEIYSTKMLCTIVQIYFNVRKF